MMTTKFTPSHRFLILFLAALFVFALTACRDRGPGAQAKGTAIKISRAAFNIGKPDKYQKPGVYDQYLKSKNVFIVSNEHGMVVVLAARCPKENAKLFFDDVPRKFKCPKCASRFTENGLKVKGVISPTSMARCRVDLIDGSLVVRPSRMFLHENKRNTWSSPFSMYVFGDDEEQSPVGNKTATVRDYRDDGRERMITERGSGKGILGNKK
ncbi:hypothetical protein [Poriferisphaera sp. WC338]|uniref:hypothetical protein n=1 Tax=Poriferisphaera sp. WC338 TaxID=3425129 RepID=UPI003D8199DE